MALNLAVQRPRSNNWIKSPQFPHSRLFLDRVDANFNINKKDPQKA